MTTEQQARAGTGGWTGIAFAVLLFVSAVMVTAPASDSPAGEIATFYADNRAVVIVAQAIGLAAAVLFLAFALRFALAATPGPADPDKWRLVWTSGVLVFAAAVVTALPPIVLALTARAAEVTSSIRILAELSDVTDAALFLTISLFMAAVATQAVRTPSWLRAGAAGAGLVALGRAATGFARADSPLDILAPLFFIALVLAASVWMLGFGRRDAPPAP